MDAIMRGDKSGTVLHRSFVCGAETLGIVASRNMGTTPAMVRFHARQVQAAWGLLPTSSEETITGPRFTVRVRSFRGLSIPACRK